MKIKSVVKLDEVGISSTYPLHNKIQFRLLLNMLLASRYNLQPYITCEGGLTGDGVRLINSRNLTIGLQKDTDLRQSVTKKEKEILDWYEKILKTLFIEGVLGKTMPHILWIDENKKQNDKERFNLFLKSIIFSEMGMSIDEKINFTYKKYVPSITFFLQNHLYKDEFLPLHERGFLHNIKK